MILQNPTLWESLVQAFTAGRLDAPIILAGQHSVGKTTLIQKFCQRVWCKSGGEDSCQVCQQVISRLYPDLFWVEREDGASEIKLEQTQALLQRLASTSLLGGVKIAVISEAEYLNASSGNALLKYLEELSPRCLFFLSTNQPSRLLPTIRSRAMYLSLPPVSHDKLLREFSWDPNLSALEREQQIWLSGGCPGFLMRWQEDEAFGQEVKERAELVGRWWQGDRAAHREIITSFDKTSLAEQRDTFQELIRLLELWIVKPQKKEPPGLNRLPALWHSQMALRSYVSPRLLLDTLFYTSL